MESKIMDYSRYKYFAVLLLLINSCTQLSNKSNDFENLKYELHDEFEIELKNDIKRVFILTEEHCNSCNRNFAKLIENYLNDKESILIINAKGTQVDISNFLKTEVENKNLYINRNIKMKSDLFNSTKVFFLKDNNLDTIINITANQIEQQFNYILAH